MLPDLGVIVCTQGATVAQRVRGLRLGADDWVAKPCHPDEVMARIEAVVRRHRRGARREDARAAGGRRAGDPARPVPGLRGRREPRADSPRVRAPRQLLADARRQGARARRDLPAGVGLLDDPRRSLGGRVRPQAALEAPASARPGGSTSTPTSGSATASTRSRSSPTAMRSRRRPRIAAEAAETEPADEPAGS